MRATEAKRTLRGDARGQGLVEFALMVPFVLLLLFGIFEFSHYYFTRLTVRHGVLEATRFAVTGNVLEDEETGDELTRVESIVRVVRSMAATVPVDVEQITVTPPDGGGPGDVVRVSVTYAYVFTTPMVKTLFNEGSVTFTVTTAMRNEPFS